MAPAQKPGRSKQDYATPADFIRAVKTRLHISEFYIDLAADETNTQAMRWITGTGLSLKTPWPIGANMWAHDEWAWLNPPYSDIEPWARKCAEYRRRGGQVALLVPASVGSNWFRDHVDGQARVLLLNGRLAFIPNKPKWLYPKDCVLALYSPALAPGYEIWPWREQETAV